MLMSGVSDSLSLTEYANLKNYLDNGGNLFLTQTKIKTNLQVQQAFPIQSNIFDLTKEYGFLIAENLVTDKICGRVSVQQQMGPIRMNVPMEYPLLPIIRSFNNNEAIVSGLEQIQLIFASEINLDSSSVENLNVVPLFFTSNQSGEMRGNFNLNPDPSQNPFISIFNQSDKILSARSEKIHTNGILSQMILVSDSDFMTDEGGGRSPENQIFIMNAVDYLIGDRDLIALRSREITSRPLEEVADDAKKRWKWLNIILPSFLIVGFGLIRMRQQKNRSSLLEEFYG